MLRFVGASCLLVELDGEVSGLTLVVPSRCPAVGAEGLVCQHELAAGSKVLALGDDALVGVDVVLPAVLGLVLVGEAGIEAYVRRSLVSRPYRISGAVGAILAGGAGRRASPGVAYQQ